MKTSRKLIMLAVAAYGAFQITAEANISVFLKLEGVDGESTETGHVGEIDAVSFKAGVFDPTLTTFAGGGASRAKFNPITVFKVVDKSSPVLFLACATGKHFATATLSITRLFNEVPVTFFKIVLSDVIISSINVEGNENDTGDSLMEPVTLSYSKIQWSFISKNSEGTPVTVTGGWDLRLNRPLPNAPVNAAAN